MSTQTNGPTFYTPGDAGRELHLTAERVRQMIAAGQIAAIQTAGGRWLISAETLAAEKRRRSEAAR